MPSILKSSLLFVTLLVPVASTATAQTNRLDTTYIANDSFFAVTVNVKGIMGTLKEKPKILEMFTAEIKEETGIDFNSMESFTIQMAATEDSEEFDDDNIAITLRTSEPIDREALFRNVEVVEHELDGKKYYVAERVYGPSFFLPNDRTVIVSHKGRLEVIMSNEYPMNEITAKFRSIDASNDVAMVFVRTESCPPLVDRAAGEIGREMAILPFDLQEVVKQVKGMTVIVNSRSAEPINIELRTGGEQHSKQVDEALNSLIDLGKRMIPVAKAEVQKQLENLKDEEKPFREMMQVQFEMAHRAVEIGEKVIESTSIVSSERTVQAKVRVMGGMPELAQLFVDAFVATTGVSVDKASDEVIIEKVDDGG